MDMEISLCNPVRGYVRFFGVAAGPAGPPGG
jgi:hypothetical protein